TVGFNAQKNELITKKRKMIYLGMIGAWQLIIILVVVLLGILPTIIALVDILKSEFTGNNKIVWLLVVLFTNFFGTILYFLIGREQKIKE
ncbi:PLD nuclease N-terminal domain-containing protein, partial [Thalassobellus citreus]|uniref:PLD nuclease N-terminal domain-containing protein n=1 Tax=Thalassobellus citreus TaxID=3367752 RepID=UPI003798B76C